MNELRDLFDGLVADTDAVFLFSPSTSSYETLSDGDGTVVVVGPENAVGGCPRL